MEFGKQHDTADTMETKTDTMRLYLDVWVPIESREICFPPEK